ncbi:hypothetical protein JG688_00002789, partial [Phytophthora aleatoria]
RDPARVDTPEGTRLYLIELLEAVDKKLTRIDKRPQRIEESSYQQRDCPRERELSDAEGKGIIQAPPEPPEQAASTHPPLKKRKRRSNN